MSQFNNVMEEDFNRMMAELTSRLKRVDFADRAEAIGGEFDSGRLSLNLFFEATAEKNLGMEGLYLLGTGFARMLEKLVQQHGMVEDR